MNNKELIYTEDFRNSIKEINKQQYYIQKNFYDVILSKTENLRIFPYMYPIFNNKKKIRKISIKNYIILYEIKKDAIYIVNIISVKSNDYNQSYQYINKV